jgi:large subunit ribosomal protein L4
MKLEVLDINGQNVGRQVELPNEVFGLELSDNHEHVVYLAVKQYLAQQRQGTHKSKQRNEVSGSTRKLHKQKGTGGSRKGSIKNPLYRGGGRIFGPQPRSYDFKINNKVSRLARIAALSSKARENRLLIVSDLVFESPKTKKYLSFLSSVHIENTTLSAKKTLLLLNPGPTPLLPSMPVMSRGFRGRKKAFLPELKRKHNDDLNNYTKALSDYKNELDNYESSILKSYTNVVLSCNNIPNADVLDVKDLNIFQIMNANYLIISESSISKIVETLIK